MPLISYGTGAYRRDNGNMPELRLVNMFVETAPTSETGAILLSREGLTEHSAPGTGPVTGVFREVDVFDGDVFTVSGGTLYRGTTSLGAISGSGHVSFAASDTELAITAGSTLYRYSEADGLDAVVFPDDREVRHVIYESGYFLAATSDGGRWYFSAVLDADSWAALDFATAEQRPDGLYRIAIINGVAYLLGAATIEPWSKQDNAELPYALIPMREIARGVLNTACAQELDNTLIWVGDDKIVYRLGDVPQRISDHGIEERIQASANVATFSFQYQGHQFFAIRLDDGTWAYDLATQQWCELASYGRSNFRGQCATMLDGGPLFGDDEDGKVWEFGGWDDDGSALERVFAGYFPVPGGEFNVARLNVEANAGSTEVLSGQGSEPTLEMRPSYNGGRTWDEWEGEPGNLGAQGQYGVDVEYRSLGDFRRPGGIMEFRCTDPCPLRISSVRINEDGGGRSA